MAQISPSPVGKVFLVGAGPGDAGLITVRGADCLRQAQVVLYDYLVNPRIVERAAPAAEKICLGRHGHTRIWSQAEINDRMVRDARSGKIVVRLKGGDPSVFARGAEEAEHLRQQGIPLEIVPGITAALAAGSYAGIPVTHRDAASAVALVTGQETQDRDGRQLDWAALARFPGTLVVYMGVTTSRQWTAALLEAGKPADTPAAIIHRCSLPDQRTWVCRLDEVAEGLASHRRFPPPVVVIVGEVVAHRDASPWFQQRPLFGTSVLATRPADQLDALADPLEALGARVLRQPAIAISPPDDWAPVDSALDRLGHFQWLVFSSANGVRYLLDRLLERGRDLRALGSVRLAAIGPGTAQQLQHYHLQADLQPEEFRAEALAEALGASARGQRLLLVRASRGRETLAAQLEQLGGQVEQVVAYQSRDVTAPDEWVREELEAGTIDFVTVTSSAIAGSLARMFGPALSRSRLVTISPLTSDALRQLGFEPVAEARSYTIAGVVEAIVRAVE